MGACCVPDLCYLPLCKSSAAVAAKLLQSCPALVTPWTVFRQAPLSMGFSRQEYWSGLPCPPPGDLPDPGIEPASLKSSAFAGRFFTASAMWESSKSSSRY